MKNYGVDLCAPARPPDSPISVCGISLIGRNKSSVFDPDYALLTAKIYVWDSNQRAL